MVLNPFKDAVISVARIIEEFERNGHVPLDHVKKAFDGWTCQDDSEEDWCFSTQGKEITVYFDSPNRIFVDFSFVDDIQLTESVDKKWHSVVYMSSLRNPSTVMYHLKGPPTPGSEFEKALGYSVSSDEEEFMRVVIHAIHLPECNLAYMHSALGLLE
jgi:hypothetical protein